MAKPHPSASEAIHQTAAKSHRRHHHIDQLLASAEVLGVQPDSLIELAHDSIFIRDLAGKVLYWNSGSELLYGYTKREAVGQLATELLATQHPISHEHTQQLLLNQGFWEGELVHTAKDGRRVVVLSRWALRRDQGEQPEIILEINTDITAQKQAENELRHYRAMVEQSSDVIISRTLDGTILSWNAAAEQMYGYTAQEMIGHKADRLFPLGQEQDFKALNHRLATEGLLFFNESQRVTKSGKILDLEISFSPIYDQQGHLSGAVSVSRDITDRKQAAHEHEQLAAAEASREEAERLNERLLILDRASQRLLESADDNQILTRIAELAVPSLADWSVVHLARPDGSVHRLKTAYADKRLADLASAFELDYAVAAADQLTPNLVSFFTSSKPRLTNRVTQVWHQRAARDAHHGQLLRQLDPIAVMTIPLIVSDQVIATISLMRLRGSKRFHRLDFLLGQELSRRASLALESTRLHQLAQQENTERRQAQEALRRSEERYRAFIAQSNEGIWRLEVRHPFDAHLPIDQQIELMYREVYLAECNDAFAKMFGYGQAQELIGRPLSDFLIRSDPQNIAYLTAMITNDYRLTGYESSDYDRYGNVRYFRNNTVGIVEAGRLVRCWGTQQDVTISKKLEHQKDEFMGIASHELKTPVTSLKAFTQILHRRLDSTQQADATGYLEKMDGQINRLTALINELLDVTKIQSGRLEFELEEVDMRQISEEVVSVFQHTVDTHQIIVTSLPAMTVMADRDRIGQVLLNLLSNAVKYSPEANQVKVWATVEDDLVHIFIQDFGSGIALEDQLHIFERFYRSDNAGSGISGLGLGLYISSEIVQRHHGQLSVTSQPGQGSVFCLTLPLVAS